MAAEAEELTIRVPLVGLEELVAVADLLIQVQLAQLIKVLLEETLIQYQRHLVQVVEVQAQWDLTLQLLMVPMVVLAYLHQLLVLQSVVLEAEAEELKQERLALL
jgi:hypothetical protein